MLGSTSGKSVCVGQKGAVDSANPTEWPENTWGILSVPSNELTSGYVFSIGVLQELEFPSSHVIVRRGPRGLPK